MANSMINSFSYGNNIYTFSLPYGTCGTAAGTAAKTVDVDNFSLETGARVLVKFTVTNTASSLTLNVENTGAKAIYYKGAAVSKDVFKANCVYEFVYDGTNWQLIGDINNISIVDKTSSQADTADWVYAITNLEESGTDNHTITPTYKQVTTKAYVDKIATGHVKYLGTVSALTGLSTTAGQGDFYRVSTAFTFGSETAHVGDIILATTDNPKQNATDWDLIHAELDTNSWVANTKTAAGYVSKGEGNANKVWKTDDNGNPAWREDANTQVTQTATTTNANYPLLLAPSGQTETKTTISYFDSGVTLNPSTNTIAANISGNAGTATKLQTARTISVSGTAGTTGTNFDGTTNISLVIPTHLTNFNRLEFSTSNNTFSPTAQSIVLNGVNGSDDNAKAPGIGFHIGNKNWASLKFLPDGTFRFYNNGGTGYQPVYASTFYGALSGNATTATKLATARTISLTGDVTGSTTFDGSGNASITATVADDSHNHTISNIDNLQSSLDSKLSLSGGTMTGNIKLTNAAVKFSYPNNTNQTIISVDGGTEGSYGYRLQYNGTGSGNDNTLVLIADNQEGTEVNAIVMKQDGTTTFAKKITASGGITGDLTGNATTATNVAWSGVTSKPSYYDSKAIKGITRSGTTFTYTCMDGTTGTFTQQDNNTTYTFATGDNNGQIKVTPSGGSAQNIAVKGLGSAAYTASTAYATAAQGTKADNALPKAGGTMTGALNFVNGAYNKVGDDVAIGDINIAGTLGVKGLNGNTAIQLVQYGTSTDIGTSVPGVRWTCTGNGTSTISGTLGVSGLQIGECALTYDSTNKSLKFTFN